MKMKKLIFAMAVVAAGAASAVSFSYQGALKTAEGGQIPANERNKVITFRLYNGPTATDVLWGRQYAVHLNDDGLFNVELSDTAGSQSTEPKPFTNSLDYVLAEYAGKEQNLYIGLDVKGSSGEIRPRQKLLNVPSAAFAADVATAKRDFAVSGKITIGNVVTAKNGLEVSEGTLKLGPTVKLDRSGDLAQGIIPRGVVVMWSGEANKIPTGWQLCNGDNGSPDLRGRFVVGTGRNKKNPGTDFGHMTTGGEETVTLTADQMPEHSHSYWGGWNEKCNASGMPTGTEDGTFTNFSSWNTGSRTAFRYETSKVGSSSVGGHNNIPPYYALCFIMKL